MCFCTPRVPSGKLTCFPGKGGPFKREVVISIIIFSGTMLNWLVVEPTHLKNMLVKLGSFFPNFRTENSKIFELPPPSKFRGCTSSDVFFWLVRTTPTSGPHLNMIILAAHLLIMKRTAHFSWAKCNKGEFPKFDNARYTSYNPYKGPEKWVYLGL